MVSCEIDSGALCQGGIRSKEYEEFVKEGDGNIGVE